MMKYFFNKHKAISFALAAAMVTTFAAESADNALYKPLKTAASDATTEAATESEGLSGAVLSDVFGETTFYRWEEVTRNNYPKDSEEHLSLFFFGNNNELASMTMAPDCIYMGPQTAPLKGVSKQITDTPIWKSTFDGISAISEHTCYYIKCEDRGYGTSNMRDEKPKEKVFFTTNDRHGWMVKYLGAGHKNYPEYQIRLQSDNGVNYYLEADEESKQGRLDVVLDPAPIKHWTFQWRDQSSRGGETWELYHYDRGNDDEELVYRGNFLTVADWGHNNDTDARWFIGKKLRFSTIKGDVTVRKDQVLVIGNDQYVSTEGKEEEANGCIIPNGETITIEKGGILSVSGELINNGTIINNGGVILIKEGGCISPFLQGEGVARNGCGTLICNDGDIIIQEGGSLYSGFLDTNCKQVPFYLEGNSNLINMGVWVYGACKLGDYANVELYETSHTYGSYQNATVTVSEKAKMVPVNGYLTKDGSPTRTNNWWGFEDKATMNENVDNLMKRDLTNQTLIEYWDCEILKPTSNIMPNGVYWNGVVDFGASGSPFDSDDKIGRYFHYYSKSASKSITATDLMSGFSQYFIKNTPSSVKDLKVGGSPVSAYEDLFKCMVACNTSGCPFSASEVAVITDYPDGIGSPSLDMDNSFATTMGYSASILSHMNDRDPRLYLNPTKYYLETAADDTSNTQTGLYIPPKGVSRFNGHVRASKDTKRIINGASFSASAGESVFYDTSFSQVTIEDLVL
ncbi:MAG: hypothetical protein IKW87_10010 [Ruminococcus sp.]|nr:hypothetical protein [Ruminococcus sp.]